MNKILFGLLVFLTCRALAAETETETIFVSGHGKDDAVPWDFFCTAGQNSGKWTTIPVPSCWELQGFGAYGYQQDPLKESGKYRTSFTVPASWKDRIVRIVFEGVMTDAEVVINGKPTGPKHHGAFYRFKYDITDAVTFGGPNRLELSVSKYSEIESVNAAERRGDYWNYGGIFRPVYLEAVPREHIERVAIDAKADGSFAMQVFATAKSADRVVAQIEGLGRSFTAPIKAGDGNVTLRTKISGQKNWTAETPALYRVTVTLESQGRPLHKMTQRFGFRTVEVRADDGIYLNGQRILLKGCCRHSFWPESGRTLSEQISRDDVALMKQMNMNAVRMSHYPPDAHFLEACDELGLYVLDEIGGWQHHYDTQIGRELLEAMVSRDVNHPAILFWDNGNEGGFNLDLDGDYAKWDPQHRAVLHPWALHDGVDTAHYRLFEEMKTKCDGTNIVMPTEFMHGLYDGGAGAGLDDYWNLIGRSKVGGGGFIWAFLDEAVVRTDQNGRLDSNGNRGPDGIVGPHREKEGSFFTVKEIWCPIQIDSKKLPETFDGTLPVENRFDFTNLKKFTFAWQLATLPAPGDTRGIVKGISAGFRANLDVAPHARGTIDLGGNIDWQKGDALFLTALDAQNRELHTWSWALKSCTEISERILHPVKPAAKPGAASLEDFFATPPTRVETAETPDGIRVRADQIQFLFGKTDGALSAISVNGRTNAFTHGPRFFASTTKSREVKDEKRNKTKHVSEPVDLSGNSTLVKLVSHSVASNVVIEAAYTGMMKSVTWTVMPGGWARCEWEYNLDGECDIAGVAFDYPESNMKSVRWLGNGPYRVWKNRLKGTTLGVWTNEYNDNEPGENWNYPEFRGYFGPWNWAEFTTTEGRILLANEDDATFLGVYRPRDAKEPMDTKLFVPQSGIAILNAIPPIGCKFMRADKLGPQSQRNVLSGSHHGAVLLHFDAGTKI